ncbi:MAG: response regulator transcription factor [Dehalococcoidia bacterium]|nr:response regulator transcription factor [Dehalococcoidia bacterium]
MKILLVDDEKEFLKVLEVAFQVYRPGYRLITAVTGTEGLAMVEKERPDLIVLDVMLPDMEGFEVCRHIRARTSAPIIHLTARDREEDVVQGLESGADDYITKPFGYRTLMARVDALLRRAGGANGGDRPDVFHCGDLTVDFVRRQVTLKGKKLYLTAKEYRIIEELARHPGQVVSHKALLTSIWGEEYHDEPQYLKTYVYRLRRKIEVDPRHPQYIITHYGDGYCLRNGGPSNGEAHGCETPGRRVRDALTQR